MKLLGDSNQIPVSNHRPRKMYVPHVLCGVAGVDVYKRQPSEHEFISFRLFSKVVGGPARYVRLLRRVIATTGVKMCIRDSVIPQDIATYQTADEEPAGGNEDAGVVGPIPADAPEAKPDVPLRESTPRESTPPAGEKMTMPVQGRITSEFGWRKHPVYQDWRYHTGVDRCV